MAVHLPEDDAHRPVASGLAPDGVTLVPLRVDENGNLMVRTASVGAPSPFMAGIGLSTQYSGSIIGWVPLGTIKSGCVVASGFIVIGTQTGAITPAIVQLWKRASGVDTLIGSCTIPVGTPPFTAVAFTLATPITFTGTAQSLLIIQASKADSGGAGSNLYLF